MNPVPATPGRDIATVLVEAEQPLRATGLPDRGRIRPMRRRLETVLHPAPEIGVETAWRQEVAARVATLEAGEVKTTRWDEIRDRFLAKLSERRQG